MTDVLALRAIAHELAVGGVSEVILCPGSRSTPLALAVRAHPALRVRVLLDERSAGFFALGLARASRRPVAVVVTSGTAAAELLPAVVEASLARVPLVLLTADRPPELRERGAAQTIDQVGIFGIHARWSIDLPLLDGEPETRRHVRSVIGRAVATARGGPAGPVHVNIGFREPLIPSAALGPLTEDDGEPVGAFTSVVSARRVLDPVAVRDLAGRLGGVDRGLIMAGPQEDPALPSALGRLATATGFPIVADALSGVRCGPHDRSFVLGHADHLVRPGPWRDGHLPELVIRFGATMTSKPMLTLLETAGPAQIVVDGDRGWSDPAILPTTFVHADAAAAANALADELANGTARDPGWARAWCEADRAADRALADWLEDVVGRGEPFEGLPFALLGDLLPDGAMLWAGNSMPVRDMDDWLLPTARAIRPMSNRGANGIDGVVSTALGAASAGAGPVALVIGDLSFLHDLNALVAARLHGLSATIVLVDNDGGGIFSFLPQATADAPAVGLPDHYEELFGTPHGIDVGPIVTALGGEFVDVSTADLRPALAESIAAPGVQVLRYRTDRSRNVELHREAAAVVAAALPAR
ncbi:MAG: 2-succinyl-5-enolpyruvyl-6-hydroxy-3-cyclohexene-1-carboxylic-acid synthase [Chloroflexota bacterium]